MFSEADSGSRDPVWSAFSVATPGVYLRERAFSEVPLPLRRAGPFSNRRAKRQRASTTGSGAIRVDAASGIAPGRSARACDVGSTGYGSRPLEVVEISRWRWSRSVTSKWWCGRGERDVYVEVPRGVARARWARVSSGPIAQVAKDLGVGPVPASLERCGPRGPVCGGAVEQHAPRSSCADLESGHRQLQNCPRCPCVCAAQRDCGRRRGRARRGRRDCCWEP